MNNYNELDQNEALKNEIKTFVRQEMLKAAREISTSVAEQVAKEVVTDSLCGLIAQEIAKYNTSKLEGLVTTYLKKGGAISHLNNPLDVRSIDIFLEDNIDDNGVIGDGIIGCPTEEVYEFYLDMCESQHLKPVHKKMFSREINRKYGVKSVPKSINGKSVRIYTR